MSFPKSTRTPSTERSDVLATATGDIAPTGTLASTLRCRCTGAALTAHLRQEAAHRSCQARVLVGDHQFDAAETSLQELLEELRPTVDSSGPSVMARSRR